MQEVMDMANKRVSCTFDAFADDLAEQYNAVQHPRPQLLRNDAMLKQSRWQQWAVRITSDPVRSSPCTVCMLASKLLSPWDPRWEA